MKLLHIADLHLGKSIHGVSLIENGDQVYWVDRFVELVRSVSPDAVLIAGDVFDRSAPSEDAVALFSKMLAEINDKDIPVMTIAGNHDSIHRLSYVSPVLSKQGLHFSRSLSDTAELKHVTLNDEFGPVTFWLMPYVFPALISGALGDDSLRDYSTAVKALIDAQGIDFSERNVLIAHQNVTYNGIEAERGGSETMIGGVGQIDFSVFEGFDYVALGHIHSSYHVGRETVRYAGSPICYHFDEIRQQKKGPVLVELGSKEDEIRTETLTIAPMHPMRMIAGDYETIRSEELERSSCGEYLSITLEDTRVTPEIATFFRELFGNRDSILMEIKSTYNRFVPAMPSMTSQSASKSTEELFSEFYTERRGGESPEESEYELMSFAGELMRNSGNLHVDPEPEVIGKLVEHLMRTEGSL